jgi:hypothetical protein
MNGIRVGSSHSANFRQCCFSPRLQPWSLHRQMVVLVYAGEPVGDLEQAVEAQRSRRGRDVAGWRSR